MTISLRQARRMMDKSQNELADMLHVHVQTYRKLEENPDLVTIEQAKKISKYLGISHNEIFFAN